jgi:hypothetical protein
MSNKQQREEQRVKLWFERIDAAQKHYQDWEKEFQVGTLEGYYRGRQWAGLGLTDDEVAKRYVINLLYASVEAAKPGLLFHKPQVKVKPRPAREDDLTAGIAEAQAELSQDAVQTFIDRPDIKFAQTTNLAIHDAHFRFGVVEVGYTADLIENPNAGRPVLEEEAKDKRGFSASPEIQGGEMPDPAINPAMPANPMQLTQPEKIIQSERLFVKRIPARDYFVSISSKNLLDENDWVGYRSWHYVEDVKKNPNFRNTRDLKETSVIKPQFQNEMLDDENERRKRHGMVEVWKIWDLRTNTRMVLARGHNRFLLEGQPFKFLPFADLKFFELPDQYYPLPVVFNWKGPQDEVNDIRDMRRLHRKRFVRRMQAVEGMIEKNELEKLETGEDGVVAWVKQQGAVSPIPDAPLDAAVFKDAEDSKNDFTEVSGVSSESRSLADATSATQANIINTRMELRESRARLVVAEWLGRVARLMLLTLRERMSMPFMIALQTKVQPTGLTDPNEIMMKADLWQMIQSDELGNLDMDISVELSSMTPLTEQEERANWNQVLALLTNPSIVMLLGQSPILLRKTLTQYGIKSETEIQEIMKILSMMAMMSAMAMGQGGAPGAGGPGVASMPGSNTRPPEATGGGAIQ